MGRGGAAEALSSCTSLLQATTVKKLSLGGDEETGLRFKIADGDQTKEVFTALIAALNTLDAQVCGCACVRARKRGVRPPISLWPRGIDRASVRTRATAASPLFASPPTLT